MMPINRKKFWMLAAMITLFGAGIFVGYIGAPARDLDAATFFSRISPLRSASTEFKFIDPLIAYETPEATPLEEYASLKQKLRDIIDTAKRANDATDVSLYYRDFNTGRWIAINRNVMYYPASLLKVPVLIAYFRKAESDSTLFEERVVYRPLISGNAFETASTLVAGRSYTMRDLLERMIVQSDNGATYTLISKIDPGLLSEVYTDLGIKDPGDDSSQYEISAKTYALFFRVLYNATYLTPAASEAAIELLSRTSYDDGLVSGVPAGIQVAHKYGEHVVSDGSTITGVELHDCGIVYRPERPYFLCVMTSAKDLSKAAALISSISNVVYHAPESAKE